MTMQQFHTLQDAGLIPAITTKYVKCPECRGEGKQLIGHLPSPSGPREFWEYCKICEGEGQFEEEEYLILKLQGIV